MMSASRSDSRNSSGPSKSRMRMRTAPRPWATWASEPAPPGIRYLAAKRTASSFQAAIAIRGLKISIASTSSTTPQQVLVVGDGVQPVERVRHVDEPALALDLGDRLLERHPARDLLLDEEADDLALVGGLDLLADDHLDAVLGGLGARLERAGDLVVVGHRDRPEAALAGGREQHVDRRHAVVRVVGVHVQVDVDHAPLREPLADLARHAHRRPAARRQLGVDLLDLGRRRALHERSSRGAAARAARRVAREALELAGEHVDVAGLEPAGRRRRGPPRRRAGGRRRGPRRRRARARAARARAPGRARRRPRRRRWPAPRSRCCRRPSRIVSRSRRRLRSAPVGAAPVGEKTVAAHSSSSGSRRSARRNSRSACRSSWAQNANRTGPSYGGRSSASAPGASRR